MKLFFSRKKRSFFSYLITKFTKSKWSHCGLILDEVHFGDNILITESNWKGITIGLLSNYKNSAKYDLEIIEISTDLCIDKIIPYINNKYGFLQILGFAIAKLFRLKSNPFTKGIVCSEYLLLLLKNSGLYVHFDDLNPQKTTPEDIYRRVKEIKGR